MPDDVDYQLKTARNHLKLALETKPDAFKEAYAACRTYTMTSVERLYALHQAMSTISRHRIPGDIVECGVWRGGSLMMAAYGLKAAGDTTRRLVACDTFEGHPRPDAELDRDVWGRDMAAVHDEMAAAKQPWARVDLEEVRANLESTGYPSENIVLVKGMVEETLPSDAIKDIAVLRLDTDWYASTKHILETLYSRLSYGGVLIVDDYGHMDGARRATDEFVASCPDVLHLIHVDYAGVFAVKCPPQRRAAEAAGG